MTIRKKFNRYYDDSPAKRRYFEIRVLVALAGTVAHDVICPGRKHDIGDLSDDEQQAKELIRDSLWILQDDRDAAFSRLKIKARKKIDEN